MTSEFVSNKSRILELLEAERAKAAMRLDEVRQRRAEMTTPTKRRRGEGSSGIGIRKDLYKVALLLREANKISQYLKKNLVSFPTFFCVNHRVWVICVCFLPSRSLWGVYSYNMHPVQWHTHSYFSLEKERKSCIQILNHPLQFDMFMTYSCKCSTLIPCIIMCVWKLQVNVNCWVHFCCINLH